MKKRILSLLLALLLCTALLTPVFAASGRYIVDHSGLLSDQELGTLDDRAAGLKAKHGCEVCILTVDSLGGMGALAYAENYAARQLDTNDYLLLLVSIEARDFAFTSGGLGAAALKESARSTLETDLRNWLRTGDYAGAFSNYLNRCDSLLQSAKSGKTLRLILGIALALGLGFLLSLIPLAILKGKLKNLGTKAAATEYASGGIQLELCEDRYLRTGVDRVRVAQPVSANGGRSGSGGGSSGHPGGSGKF